MEDFSNFFFTKKIKLFKNSESIAIYVNLENVTSCMFQNVDSNTFDEKSWFEIIFHESFNHKAWNYANRLFKSFSRRKKTRDLSLKFCQQQIYVIIIIIMKMTTNSWFCMKYASQLNKNMILSMLL